VSPRRHGEPSFKWTNGFEDAYEAALSRDVDLIMPRLVWEELYPDTPAPDLLHLRIVEPYSRDRAGHRLRNGQPVPSGPGGFLELIEPDMHLSGRQFLGMTRAQAERVAACSPIYDLQFAPAGSSYSTEFRAFRIRAFVQDDVIVDCIAG
jgi:hypothetical protein